MAMMTEKEVKEYLLSFITEENMDRVEGCVDDEYDSLEELKENFDWRNGHAIEELLEVTYGNTKYGVFPKEVISLVDHFGGEDCGSTYWTVYKVIREGFEDTYIRFNGHYDSWNGTEWYDEFDVVTPVKKIVEVTEWV